MYSLGSAHCACPLKKKACCKRQYHKQGKKKLCPFIWTQFLLSMQFFQFQIE